jgi:hypothetical protein
MALVNTFNAIDALLASHNPNDTQIQEAFREVKEALTGISGSAAPTVLDLVGTPTDVTVGAEHGGIEVFDGMEVYMRSGANLTLWRRVAGVWRTVVAGA